MLHKHNIFNGIWMMEDGFAANYFPLLVAYLKGEAPKTPHQEINPLTIQPLSSSLCAPQAGDNGENESYIAVVSIAGAITKHSQYCGPEGMVQIAAILEECYATDNINGIILHVESGGGDGMAMRLLNETIGKRNKPMVGFVDDFACSAAYGIVSGCDIIVANSAMARVGSIGTYLSIADYTKQLEKEGINIMTIYAPDSKHKNGEVREALKGNFKPLEELAAKYNDSFLESIEKNREGKLTASREIWGTGRVFFADAALKLGLIDNIDTFQNTLNYFT